MKILETALFAQQPRYLQELLSDLTLEEETVLGLDVFRLEVDEDLAILIYDLSKVDKILPDILEHLSRHLSALLIAADENVSEIPAEIAAPLDELAGELAEKAIVVAVRAGKKNLQALNAPLANSGFYLSEKGRVIFWNPDEPATVQHIWNMLWNTLQAPVSVE